VFVTSSQARNHGGPDNYPTKISAGCNPASSRS